MSSNQSELDSLTAKTALAEEIADSIIDAAPSPEAFYIQNLTSTNTQATLLIRDSITENFDGGVYEIETGAIIRASVNSSIIELNLKLTTPAATTITLVNSQSDDILGRKTFRNLKYITILNGVNTIFTDFKRTVAGTISNIDYSYIIIKKLL